MNEELFEYGGTVYPSFLRDGNAMQYIAPIAAKFCVGHGVDVGCGKWPLAGAIPVELKDGGDAMELPEGSFDYIASSHCLEHLVNPISALEHWKSKLRPGGVLFLYLPHPDMSYWRPENCAKHLHLFYPEDVASALKVLGFANVLHSERDLYWSFCVVGWNG